MKKQLSPLVRSKDSGACHLLSEHSQTQFSKQSTSIKGKLKAVLLAVIMAGFALAPVSSWAQYVTVGGASYYENNCYKVTQGLYNEAGAIWYTN